jgi:hypothetical protein
MGIITSAHETAPDTEPLDEWAAHMPGHRYIGDQWRNGPTKIVVADDSRGGRDFSGRDAIAAAYPPHRAWDPEFPDAGVELVVVPELIAEVMDQGQWDSIQVIEIIDLADLALARAEAPAAPLVDALLFAGLIGPSPLMGRAQLMLDAAAASGCTVADIGSLAYDLVRHGRGRLTATHAIAAATAAAAPR